LFKFFQIKEIILVYVMPCSKCKQSGHNARSCSSEIKVQETNAEPVSDNLDSVAVAEDEEADDEAPSTTKITKYYCYFLGQHNNWSGQTYNGYTVNLSRRLRQHNGEIKGGAWATTAKDKGAWSFIAALTSDSWASVSRAMACEWNCRYPTRKKPRPKIFAGAKGRINSLVEIFKHIKDDVRLYIHPTFYDHAVSLGLPSHVVLYKKLDEIL
jgi:predicted GIY-YIG superfamily endonuclease